MQSHVVWFDEPQPPSGRLSRDRIVEAAIELADADVRGEVTMRAVAARLGSSTPMSLYRYVGSKDGLTDLMLDRVTAEIAVPAEGTWQERLRGLALSARAAVRRHPWFARLTFSRPPFGPHSLAMFDAALAGPPVVYDERADVWHLFRYDDVRDFLRQPALWSTAKRMERVPPSQRIIRLLTADPPAHTELRNHFSRAYRPRRIAAMEPRIRTRALACRARERLDCARTCHRL